MNTYQVPNSDGMIKLDAMEIPYSMPEELKQSWVEKLRDVDINRYPDSNAEKLKKKITDVMSIPDGVSIMLGNGSDELIQIIALAMAEPGRTFIAPEPSFVMYKSIATTVGVNFIGVPLNDDYSLSENDILEAIETHQPAVIFLAYPNNPTGNSFDDNIIIDVTKNAPGLVIIDEAYHAFSGKSFITRLSQFDNLLVMRTLSKAGLAGLRLGFLTGLNEWLVEFEKLRLPYNVNSLSQASAEFMLTHHEVLDNQAQKICQNRDHLYSKLLAINGIEVWPSDANFIMFRTLKKPADEIYNGLMQNGILIKQLHNSHPTLNNCLRVTVGASNENSKFLDVLDYLMNS